ncbi:RICIN domain-containing protein [Yinghuangia sp. YIM S09857]|uniref:RICIN domain-containing protein n=1 Tax=Yinghuangia sp. YIM S09857 TaxID=3436929 RepID=UPI003F52C9CF
MVSRRIVAIALGATALVGLLFGGVFGVLGGGDDDKSPAAAASPTSAPPGPSPLSAAPSSAPPSSSPPSTSASPSKSPTTSKPPSLKSGTTYVLTLGGRAMDVYGGDKDDNTPVIVYTSNPDKANQQWTVHDAGGGYVYLVSRVSNKCLDMQGGHAVQDGCGKERQQWQARPSGKGFVLVNRSGQALAVGEKVRGQQGLRLVPAASGAVWTFTQAR